MNLSANRCSSGLIKSHNIEIMSWESRELIRPLVQGRWEEWRTWWWPTPPWPLWLWTGTRLTEPFASTRSSLCPLPAAWRRWWVWRSLSETQRPSGRLTDVLLWIFVNRSRFLQAPPPSSSGTCCPTHHTRCRCCRSTPPGRENASQRTERHVSSFLKCN